MRDYRREEKVGEMNDDLVVRAGGVDPHGYLYAAQLTRDSVRTDQAVKLKALIQQETLQILSPSEPQIPPSQL